MSTSTSEIHSQITGYINSQPEDKRKDIQELHDFCLSLMPGKKLWFLDGKDEHNKIVTNPNIGYGELTISYADGSSRPFYQIGLSANSSGISVYIMGLKDRKYLPDTYGTSIGKAKVTGYCIRFIKLADIDKKVLGKAIKDGVKQTS